MANQSVINVDLADLFEKPNRTGYIHTLAWGDAVVVLETTSTYLRIRTVKYENKQDGSILPVEIDAYICPQKSSGKKPEEIVIPRDENQVLKVNFTDVQQGDGTVIESPDGKIILVDGGENQMFARYLASRFLNTSQEQPREIDCIIVTHGDADHFAGLTEIFKSEKNPEPRKRLFIAPKRVYHNGIIKRPNKDENGHNRSDVELLGPTKKVGDETILTGLVANLLDMPDKEMNKDFKDWKKALAVWNNRNQIEFRRLSFGQNDAFDFFNNNDLKISILGPFLTEKDGIRGLKFLGNPPKGLHIGHDSFEPMIEEFTGFSASHTINGHSIVFRLRYGGFCYLFTGDLNEEASRTLVMKEQKGEINLRSEVFKVPHHGSAEFSGEFFKKVSPIVSIVSSGDESAQKEYIHPRATVIGDLGRYSRIDEPLIFITELVAFFKLEGWSQLTDKKKATDRGDFFAFSRTAYGIVKTRTNGKRMLVYTGSGKADLKEAYCYILDNGGEPIPSPVVRV